jgi:hypothetical protein
MIHEAKEDALYFLRKMGCTDTASKQQIEDAVSKTLKLYDGISKDELLRHIESEYKIWVDDFRIIEKKKQEDRGLPEINRKLIGDSGTGINGISKKRKNFRQKQCSQ